MSPGRGPNPARLSRCRIFCSSVNCGIEAVARRLRVGAGAFAGGGINRSLAKAPAGRLGLSGATDDAGGLAGVAGAAANDLPGAVPEEVKEERYARIMEKTAAISAAKLQAKIGRTLPVIIDMVGEPDEDGDIGATGRSQADAPEIDGAVQLREVPATLQSGDIVQVTIEDADEHDLFGAIAG